MPKTMQNLVVLMELSGNPWNISSKAGNMCLNRFCIDEDAAFELSGAHCLDELFDFNWDFELACTGKEFSYEKRHRCV